MEILFGKDTSEEKKAVVEEEKVEIQKEKDSEILFGKVQQKLLFDTPIDTPKEIPTNQVKTRK